MAAKKQRTKKISCSEQVRREESRLFYFKGSLQTMVIAWKTAKDAGDARDAAYWLKKLRSAVEEIDDRKKLIVDLKRSCRRGK